MLDAKCTMNSAKGGLEERKERVPKETAQLPREANKRFSDPINW